MKITLFLLGKKGFAVLQNLNIKFYENIERVVFDEDTGVQNDYSNEIYVFCTNNKRSEEHTSELQSH